MAAYGRLIGRLGNSDGPEIELKIDKLPVTFGRNDNTKLNDDTTISRQHIMIDFDKSKNSFTIKCLSKNGIIVDKIKLSKDQDALLHDGSALKLGTAKLYFTVAVDKKRSSDGSSPPDNAEKRKRGSSAGLNEISVIPEPSPDPSENMERITYNAMVQACFDAVPPNYDLNQGIMMTWIIQWIEARYPNTTQGVLKASVNKGVFAALQKLAVRTDEGDHVIVKCMKYKPKKLVAGDNASDNLDE